MKSGVESRQEDVNCNKNVSAGSEQMFTNFFCANCQINKFQTTVYLYIVTFQGLSKKHMHFFFHEYLNAKTDWVNAIAATK